MTFLNLRIVSHNSCMNCWLSSKVCRLVGLSKLLPCSLNGLHFWVRVCLHPCIDRTICVRTWDDALIRSFGFWLFNANVIDNYGSVQGMVTIVTKSKSYASCSVFYEHGFSTARVLVLCLYLRWFTLKVLWPFDQIF